MINNFFKFSNIFLNWKYIKKNWGQKVPFPNTNYLNELFKKEKGCFKKSEVNLKQPFEVL